MHKDQKGSHILAGILFIAVLGIIIFIGLKLFNKDTAPNPDKRGASYKALAACGSGPVLNTLPTDLSKLEGIAPLGGIDPPDHTLPTDHMYMMYPYGETTQKDLIAPANIVVTALSYGEEYKDGTLVTADYTITFYPCSELKFIYGHVDTLSDKMVSIVGTPESPKDAQCETSRQGTADIKHCAWNVDISFSAGEVLGTSNGWDLWATLEGHTGNVITPAYYHNTDAVCPLDYFSDTLKAQMYSLIKRDVEPKCGEAYQDKAGTLQGGWFAHENPEQAKTDWSSHLSLVHHSQTNIGLVGVAGTIADKFLISFSPRHTGAVNREPSETATGIIYCYQHEGDQRMPNGRMAGTGKVLVKLLDVHKMQAEHKDGACRDNEAFSTPTTYYR